MFYILTEWFIEGCAPILPPSILRLFLFWQYPTFRSSILLQQILLREVQFDVPFVPEIASLALGV